MFNWFKNLFGKKTDFHALVKNGAQIIDVRTPTEYENGHIFSSINIPLQNLNKELTKIDKSRPVITCCASGIRSLSAQSILKANGYEAYNGGSWASLQTKI